MSVGEKFEVKKDQHGKWALFTRDAADWEAPILEVQEDGTVRAYGSRKAFEGAHVNDLEALAWAWQNNERPPHVGQCARRRTRQR